MKKTEIIGAIFAAILLSTPVYMWRSGMAKMDADIQVAYEEIYCFGTKGTRSWFNARERLLVISPKSLECDFKGKDAQ